MNDKLREIIYSGNWLAPRFSGSAGIIQDSYYNRLGRIAYMRRINKARKAMGYDPYYTINDFERAEKEVNKP